MTLSYLHIICYLCYQDRDKEVESLRKYSATIYSQFTRKIVLRLKVYSHCDLTKVEEKRYIATWLWNRSQDDFQPEFE